MEPAPIRVLFVCLGNICRSPAAEIVFRKMADDAGLADAYHIDSAGTAGYHEGSPPDRRMAATLERRGYHVAGRARRIARADLTRFDHILAMDGENLRDILKIDPSSGANTKVKPFVSHCTDHHDKHVPDPYYGGQEGFDHVVDLLEDGCRNLLAKTRKD